MSRPEGVTESRPAISVELDAAVPKWSRTEAGWVLHTQWLARNALPTLHHHTNAPSFQWLIFWKRACTGWVPKDIGAHLWIEIKIRSRSSTIGRIRHT